jgi:RNA polymerase sigma factor (sigma-70 family)
MKSLPPEETAALERLKINLYNTHANLSTLRRKLLEENKYHVIRDSRQIVEQFRKNYSIFQQLAKADGIVLGGNGNNPAQVKTFLKKARAQFGKDELVRLWSHYRREFLDYSPNPHEKRVPLRSFRDAFELILPFRKLVGVLMKRNRVTRRILGGAESEALFRLAQRVQFFDENKQSIESFIKESTRYIILDLQREFFGRYTEKKLPVSLDDLLTNMQIEPINPSAESITEKHALWKELSHQISQLDPVSIRVLTARYFEDKPYKDIGKDIGKSESRILKIHAAALAKLRKRMSHFRE